MASTKVPKIKLNDGNNIPILGMGSWQSKEGEVGPAIKQAIDTGYRHFDCAYCYGNEKEIGDALRDKMMEGVIKRENLFITSKVWNTFHSKDKARKCLNETLKNLGMAFLDLYLIHWPVGFKESGGLFDKDDDDFSLLSDVDYLETWRAMEEFKQEGLVKSIGVSNFNKDQIERIIENCTIVPAVNQIECHPYLNQSKMLEYCKSKDIFVTAYSPLGSPQRPWAPADEVPLVKDPKIVGIAEKYKKSPAQVLIKYQLQRGAICIPKSTNNDRIAENFNVFDFELADEDIETINSFDCNGRLFAVPWMSKSKYYPFNTEF